MGDPGRNLGASGIEVSRLALGSWRTFERITREDGARRDARRPATPGITFLDDARYDDETGTAPIPTGYSEVVFGELFRAAGWAARRGRRRQQAVVGVLARAERRRRARRRRSGAWGSTTSTSSTRTHPNTACARRARRVGGRAHRVGKARAWAIVNWPAELLAEAAPIATARRRARSRAPPSCPTASCSARRSRTPDMRDALRRVRGAGGRVVSSSPAVSSPASTTATRPPGGPPARSGVAGASPVAAVRGPWWLRELARWRRRPATLAVAFASARPTPTVASVLFGATRPEQVQQNVAALHARLTGSTWMSSRRCANRRRADALLQRGTGLPEPRGLRYTEDCAVRNVPVERVRLDRGARGVRARPGVETGRRVCPALRRRPAPGLTSACRRPGSSTTATTSARPCGSARTSKRGCARPPEQLRRPARNSPAGRTLRP